MMTCRLRTPCWCSPCAAARPCAWQKVLVRTIPLRLQQQSHQPRRPRQTQSHQSTTTTTTTKPPTTTDIPRPRPLRQRHQALRLQRRQIRRPPVRRQAFAELTAASAALRGVCPRCFLAASALAYTTLG
ncbi:putative mucin TcMUCI [Trypanosoma cruzi]|nr:putative mucin TcMUCI [Trypanosoma cruzi]